MGKENGVRGGTRRRRGMSMAGVPPSGAGRYFAVVPKRARRVRRTKNKKCGRTRSNARKKTTL